MGRAFQPFRHGENASGHRDAVLRVRHHFAEVARAWLGTVALISALVALSVIVHWSV